MLFFILTAKITIPTEFFVSIYWMSLILRVSNAIRTYNHIVYKRTLNHLAKLTNLAKWLSVHLRTKWLWIRIALPSLKLQLWRLLWARSSSTFKQTIECGFTLKLISDMIITYSQCNGFQNHYCARKYMNFV